VKRDYTKLETVHKMACDLIGSGLQAGTIYHEVWIRDYNTFIELACDVLPQKLVRENLLMFFKFQGADGNIIDGFIPKEKISQANVVYDYSYTDTAPQYAGHKNTVIADQESSLVQAVSKYIKKTGETSILQEKVSGITVLDRLQYAMEYLLANRFSEKYGLIWGDTTIDWGDVQPRHELGVLMDENSHPAISIYINAMFAIALNNLIDMIENDKGRAKWIKVRDKLKTNIRKHLWEVESNKFVPHIYLERSPFPNDFDENKLYFHGGTAMAIEAGLLSQREIASVLEWMKKNKNLAKAQSIGITVYPPYPAGYFMNSFMVPFGYHNGGDWSWWGGRMIQQLIRYGFIKEAWDEIQPMVERVIKNNGFYEWYTVDGTPKGAGSFRGEAGVLAKAIEMLRDAYEVDES
jgi:glycogen debranching enzyme